MGCFTGRCLLITICVLQLVSISFCYENCLNTGLENVGQHGKILGAFKHDKINVFPIYFLGVTLHV